MIEINDLTRRFGAAGIRDVSFTCRPGSVTGFLGPNGAGKTTTMRLLCGLDRPDAGTATIDGRPYARLAQPGRRVGVMLDPGAMHRGRTGRETLALAAAVLGVDRPSAGSAGCCASTPTGAGPCCCPRTCSVRSRSSPTTWSSSTPGGSWRTGPGAASYLPFDAGPDPRRPGAVGRPAGGRAAGRQAAMAAVGALETDAEPEQVGRIAARAGAVLTEVRPQGNDLEDLFFTLTASDHEEAA